jgi:protein SEY1
MAAENVLARPQINGHHLPNGDATSERIQIIDEEKKFTYVQVVGPLGVFGFDSRICRSDLTTQIERWGLRDAGFSYDIVAVFGSQSTGKSMLTRVLIESVSLLMKFCSRYSTKPPIWNQLRRYGRNEAATDHERYQSASLAEATRGSHTFTGIWMCRGKGMNVMVMDVEGTDGRERGEDQVRNAPLIGLVTEM